jgi:protein required for attachment to host cells
MEITWILVCDASRARLFQRLSALADWKLIEELEHPQSRAKNHDLVTDRGGRHQNNHGVTYSTAMEAHTQPKAAEAEHFARELAGRLERGLKEGFYSRLVLVAPPHFLGLLREALPHRVAGHVELSLAKDLTHIAPRELAARIHE